MNHGLYVRTISRGQGHSAVRAAAYCGRRRLYDERRRRTFNFARRPGLVYSELRLPALARGRWTDAGCFWNAVEAALTRVNARLARELIVALPRGASLEAHVRLMQGFLEDEFVTQGHAVDWHIHYNNPRNPHVHALVSFPRLNETGFGPPDKNWDRRAWLVGLHALWRRHWERAGFPSHGFVGGTPSGFVHLGSAHALMTRGVITRQGQRLAAWRALATKHRPPTWPSWLRVRLRRRERSERVRHKERDTWMRDR